jgi:hypothetical protein
MVELKVEKKPRIACHKMPKETMVICVLLLCTAALVRFLGNDRAHQVAEVILLLLTVINSLNFLIPFLRPNSILGGAKVGTFYLAGAAFVGLLAIH